MLTKEDSVLFIDRIEKRIKSVGCLPILPESVWKKQSRTQTALPNPH